jgi:hypothetical protein
MSQPTALTYLNLREVSARELESLRQMATDAGCTDDADAIRAELTRRAVRIVR